MYGYTVHTSKLVLCVSLFNLVFVSLCITLKTTILLPNFVLYFARINQLCMKYYERLELRTFSPFSKLQFIIRQHIKQAWRSCQLQLLNISSSIINNCKWPDTVYALLAVYSACVDKINMFLYLFPLAHSSNITLFFHSTHTLFISPKIKTSALNNNNKKASLYIAMNAPLLGKIQQYNSQCNINCTHGTTSLIQY